MTREERKNAIANLNMIRVALIDTVTVEQGKLVDDTFRTAIEALEQEPCDDILTLTKQVVTQVTEDIDNFIFTTIRPWCEEKEQRKISKHDLEQALIQYFGKPCHRMEKWIEERTYMECPNCGDIWHYEKNQTERFKCCPTCGKKLFEPQKRENKCKKCEYYNNPDYTRCHECENGKRG